MEAVSLIFSFFIFHISGISFYDDQKGAVKFVFRTKWGESFLAKNTWYSPSGKKTQNSICQLYSLTKDKISSPPEPNMMAIFAIMISPDHVLSYIPRILDDLLNQSCIFEVLG